MNEEEVSLSYLLRASVWMAGAIVGAILVPVTLIVIIVYPLVRLVMWCCLKNID